MSEFTVSDSAHMARALRLAERGRYTAHPNPLVGCVIVRDGEVIGEGFHERAGDAHAEINALQDAGDAKGATAYVTLEPCAFHGKTPPCAQALIVAGVARVIAAMQDPHDRVMGEGFKTLQAAGVDVEVGLLEAEAEALNPGFLKVQRSGLPYVCMKIAASLDGCVAMNNGESQWISGPAARDDVQRLRARSGAILSGIGTVLADDPSFTVRAPELADVANQPIRAILDSNLRMPLSSTMLDLPGRTLLFCTDDGNRDPLEQGGAEVFKTRGDDRVDLGHVLKLLAIEGVNDVLVEAGPAVSGALLESRLIDELVIYQAPHIMGSETTPMFRTPSWQSLTNRAALDIIDVRRVGADTRITARFKEQDD